MSTHTDALLRQGRFDLQPLQTLRLPRRMVSWTLWQTFTWLGLAALGFTDAAYAPALALGVAVCTSRPKHLPYALLVVPTLILAVLGAGSLGLPGWTVLGLLVGLAAGLLELGHRQHWRLANGALAGAALVPLGLLAHRHLSLALPGALALPIATLVASGMAACTLAVVAVGWRAVARIPSRRRIEATLGPRYREASLKALEHDKTVREMAPDRESREGLGEVAAWVYRLSLSLQGQDQELDHMAQEDLGDQVARARLAVDETEDSYTRERRQATLRHLELMVEHRDALALERQRTESLVDYALATLAEARTGLAFARRGSGHPAPEGLDEVLHRLRAHAHDQAARRDTAREMDNAV